jgi:hypothetical protein
LQDPENSPAQSVAGGQPICHLRPSRDANSSLPWRATASPLPTLLERSVEIHRRHRSSASCPLSPSTFFKPSRSTHIGTPGEPWSSAQPRSICSSHIYPHRFWRLVKQQPDRPLSTPPAGQCGWIPP